MALWQAYGYCQLQGFKYDRHGWIKAESQGRREFYFRAVHVGQRLAAPHLAIGWGARCMGRRYEPWPGGSRRRGGPLWGMGVPDLLVKSSQVPNII